jgi:hypothetical protein
MVRISRADGTRWVGCAAAGGFGVESGAFGCPDPDELCLVIGGQAFVINVWRPEAYQPLIPDVCAVRHFPGLDLLLLASPTDLTAVGRDGLRWTTARLCLDELRLVSASPLGIVCSGSFVDTDEQLVVAPEDGRLISGPVCPY